MSPPRPFRHPFLLALGVRLPLALISRTFFQPDESWQSLEIAHRLVFGFGYLTWEWRPSASSVGGIRSPIYALLFVPVLGLAKSLGAEGWTGLVLAPKLLQALIGAWTDASTAQLGQRLLGDDFSNAALVCSLLSFFNAHVSTRTFSNSAETALTAAALACWPWQDERPSQVGKKGKPFSHASASKSSLPLALSLAAVATVMRPSNTVIWLVLGIHLILNAPTVAAKAQIIRTTVLIGMLAVAVCTVIDTTFFRALASSPSSLTPTKPWLASLSFTPYTFLLQNVFNSISLFYGSNTSHFYITQALPFMTMTMLPFVLHGLCISRSGAVGTARMVVAATAATYSLLAHKEFRFVHPLLPCINVFAAHSLVTLARRSDKHEAKEVWAKLGIKRSHFAFLLVSVVPAIYLTTFHALGQNTVMDHLRTNPSVMSVGFLMPCHSTPWQGRMHRPDLEMDDEGSGEGGRAWFITCEPPVLSQAAKGYQDQTDFFYKSPIKYLQDRFPPMVDPDFPPSPFVGAHLPSQEAVDPHSSGDANDLGWWHEWPSHIVCFDVLLKEDGGQVGWYLKEMGYEVERRIWNSHFHEDGRRRGDVVVLRWIE